MAYTNFRTAFVLVSIWNRQCFSKTSLIAMCMIKIFWGGAGVVTPSKPPPPYEQLLPLPTPCFKMFLERSLNDPPPPHFKHLSLLPPHPIHHPFPPLKILIIHHDFTNFDRFRPWFDNPRANCGQGRLTARARARYNVRFELCNRIIDIGPPGQDRKQYLLTSMTKNYSLNQLA